jgi:hypothetical protein
MKKITRLGVIVLVIGISLLLVTVLRNSSSTNLGGGSEDMPPDRWRLHPSFLFAPRELRMEIQANSTIDLYILDESGINLWSADGVLRPLWEFTSVKHEIVTVQIMKRGIYAVLVHNIQNSSTATKYSISMYGFERDLFWASIALTIAGPVIIGVYMIVSRKTVET